MSGEFIFWTIIAPAYVILGLASSALFTRHWNTTQGCTPECTYRYHAYSDLRETGSHTSTCNRWRSHPRDPDEALYIAIIWPIALAYQALTKIHIPYEPKLVRPEMTIDQLDRIESIDQLDRVLLGKEQPPA